MDQPSSSTTIREIAEHLLAYERDSGLVEAGTPAAAQVCQKLGRPLGKLVGDAGSRAILKRALTLAKREADALLPVQITEDGVLEGLKENAEDASPALIAHLIGLLVTFLGEALTLRLLHGIWPDRATSDIHFGERNANESTQ